MNIYNYEWFIKEFKQISKLDLSLYKEMQMQRRIESFINKRINVLDYKKFYEAISVDKNLYEVFMEHLTINITEFYRNPSIWNILEEKIIPKLNEKNMLNIWSAGCSSGEEPYTLAMILKDKFPNIKVNILATDIDKKVLSMAKTGEYDEQSIKNLSEVYINKYFDKKTDKLSKKEIYVVKNEIKNMIEFKQHNMLQDEFPKNLDLIVCRNVVIYFKEETKDILYKKFNESLRKNGFLFVGNTEQILNYKNLGFEPTDVFFFEKI